MELIEIQKDIEKEAEGYIEMLFPAIPFLSKELRTSIVSSLVSLGELILARHSLSYIDHIITKIEEEREPKK